MTQPEYENGAAARVQAGEIASTSAQTPIRLRSSLATVLVYVSLTISFGAVAAWSWSDSPPLARALILVGPLVSGALAVLVLSRPVAVIEPDRVRRNQRLFKKNVAIDGLADLRLAKRTLWRRHDDRLIMTTTNIRRSDIRHLRNVLDQTPPTPDPALYPSD